MKKYFLTVFKNGVFRSVMIIFVFCFLAIIAASVVGHILIGRILETKNGIIDLSETATGKKYKKLTEDYNSTKSERIALSTLRPSKEEIAYFVQTVDEIASRNGIIHAVEIVASGAPEGTKYSIPVVRYRLNFSGNMVSMLNYIRDIDKTPFLTRIVSTEIVAQEEKTLNDGVFGTLIIDIATKK